MKRKFTCVDQVPRRARLSAELPTKNRFDQPHVHKGFACLDVCCKISGAKGRRSETNEGRELNGVWISFKLGNMTRIGKTSARHAGGRLASRHNPGLYLRAYGRVVGLRSFMLVGRSLIECLRTLIAKH
jgi:hypothetical protein